MPWENIGSVSTGGMPHDGGWVDWGLRFAKEYILFVCGDPPFGSELDISSNDHELGSYPSLGVWSECSPPFDYIHRCERALAVFDRAVAWDELVAHIEQETERDEESESEANDDLEDGDEGDEFVVRVADNFHYMDESETTTHGAFPAWEEAVEAAQAIVDCFLLAAYTPGMTADALFAQYTSFGDDPYIVPAPDDAEFSAWNYARERCIALCGVSADD